MFFSLVAAADVVGLAGHALCQNDAERARVVLDKEPIAHIRAIAIDRQRLAIQRIEDDQRDQLFRKMIRAVIVRAVRHDHRHAIGPVPRFREMVRGGLRGRIRRAGIVGRRLGKQAVGAKRTIDLVGRDMNEAEDPARMAPEIAAGRLEQRECANHICLHEHVGSGDRSIDVAFGSKMDDRIWPVFRKDRIDRLSLANVMFFECEMRAGSDRCKRRQIARIGKLVDNNDVVFRDLK